MSPEPDSPGGLVPPGPPLEDVPTPLTSSPPAEDWRRDQPWEPPRAAPYGRFETFGDRYLPPPSRTMAGWALGLSLALCIPFAFVVGAGLAITVLVKGRDGRDNGKGLAIAALVISGLILLAQVVYVVVLVLTGFDETERDADGRVVEGGSVTFDRIRVGDCFDEPGLADLPTDGSEGEGAAYVDVVPCSEPHQAEVFHEITLDDDGYPGDPVIDARIGDCMPEFRTYVGTSYRRSRLEVVFYYPTRTTWRFGDREITCTLVSPNARDLEGSMRGSRR